ncbi:hypothetical protein ACFL6C_04230 [Myxococcota bacterium]
MLRETHAGARFKQILLLLSALACPGGYANAETDVTADIENLGIPLQSIYASKIYARNVWDLHAFDGRIYIGSGNSSNIGPDSNAGPVEVWAYDTALGGFVKEYTAPIPCSRGSRTEA